MISVLVVDAQPLQRFGFRMLLESNHDTEIVGEAENGAEAVRWTTELHPDVVLMGIRMPGVDGIEATRRIVAAGGRSRILVLTTFDVDRYALAALRAGANGFLLKDTRPEELLAGIRAVAWTSARRGGLRGRDLRVLRRPRRGSPGRRTHRALHGHRDRRDPQGRHRRTAWRHALELSLLPGRAVRGTEHRCGQHDRAQARPAMPRVGCGDRGDLRPGGRRVRRPGRHLPQHLRHERADRAGGR
ncbi:response regulator receiver domain-containing protein [Promicromonospora sp. AC04]|nr:response regulator receiver domain-containing protein [Promicromonospora sp. AC04]